MFSIRLKLLLVLIIAGVLGILFVQNQELIALKFFCGGLNQACLYRSINLPLAAWLGIFIFAGVITSLIWQFFNSLISNPQSERIRSQPYTTVRENPSGINERLNYRNAPPDWEQGGQDEWNIEEAPSETTTRDRQEPTSRAFTSEYPETDPSYTQPKTNYEVQQQPTSVKHSGSTYSYTYREAGAKQSDQVEENVYDANYRTIKPPSQTQTNESIPNDDDEDWV
ncbi:hypothetical protein Sta7437_0349 [Stanieria cyanosphaera PCC 7437]|uniref:Lipopolysaccharide assembly protein A domain-containing protein n=1 Tax=Stanieria cyanosphaera (strain ATCC 29371 / PCC 7437) TaxID=111780 RepID=K9XPI2_STAC7|nr:pro-sigmaK processing inhibitor BofA family protein [Stanieria cyanosphaera]AFZ33961.1 hypothetical protein Sta7437_0349 [Stanieria cyanosphaera PCC 7437]